MTIASELAAFCSSLRYDDIPADVLKYTKKLVLDSLGNAVGGYYWAESGETFLGAAHSLEKGEGDTTVLATGEQLSAPNGAFANGAFAHSLDYDNRHGGGSLHIGSSVVIASLAAAERRDTSGRRFLTGVVAGYEVAARLGMACNPRSSHERGFHPTGTCGTFGATAGAAVVAGFDEDEIADAFAINGSQASGGYQCSFTGGWNKRIHPGLAARNAFLAVPLVENDFQAPTAPIEGDLGFLQAYADVPRPSRATDSLGESFVVTETTIKPYPLGTFTHVPISLLADLVTEKGIAPEEIEQITVEIPTAGVGIFARSRDDGHPSTASEAQFDMPFAAALAVTSGGADLRSFHDALDDAYPGEFGRLMEATTTVGDDELDTYLPKQYPARVVIQTREEKFERYREWVEGSPDSPIGWNALTEKFDVLTIPLDTGETATAVERIQNVTAYTGRDLVEPFRNG